MTASAKRKNKSNSSVLKIEGEMTIYRAVELKQTLLDALNRPGESNEFNLSKVTELDAAGVQLLLYAKLAAQAKNKVLRLIEHSPAVVEVFELLNLTTHFGDPTSIPSPTV